MAIATFERTLYSDRTPFDQSVAQIAPLTPAEARGQGVFNQSRCNVCHAGTLFSDAEAVTVLPGTFSTTAAGRILVGTSNSLLRVNGSGDRNFINGGGPALIPVEDMAPDLVHRRVLVGSAAAQALEWVDLDTGDRTLLTGRNPDTGAIRGTGPAIASGPLRLELDPARDLTYVAVMPATALMAVDMASGDRIIISR